MALNRIFKENERNNRVRVVPSGTVSGDPLLLGTRPAVALTDRGDATQTFTDSGTGLSVTLPSIPNGRADDEASVAFDGTWEFDGVVSTGTTPAPTSTAQDTLVYITSADALTLESSGNTVYGAVDYPKDYHKVAGTLPVRIGG
jgi:hypothetical protein